MVQTISTDPPNGTLYEFNPMVGTGGSENEKIIKVSRTSYIANNQNKYGGGSLGTPSLTVKSADRNADQAFYECSATNAIGTGTSSRTFLTVTGGNYYCM
jgi:hypothetical protein